MDKFCWADDSGRWGKVIDRYSGKKFGFKQVSPRYEIRNDMGFHIMFQIPA